jgi:hypothetical protein
MIDNPQDNIVTQVGETDRMIIDGTKVTVDTGNNYLDFLFVFGGILLLYAGKKLIDRWFK